MPTLCPFSFSFAVQEKAPAILGPNPSVGRVRVGLPCCGGNCKFWVQEIEDCVIHDIREKLSEILKELRGDDYGK